MTDRKKNRARLDYVAELAGVGIATVDRVLNERGGVAPKTAKKVLSAARTLGIGRILPSPYSRLFRIRFVMPKTQSPIFDRLKSAFEGQIAKTSNTLILDRVWVDIDDHDALKKAVSPGAMDAITAFVPETSGTVEAITDATSAGVPVITICSDLPTTPRLAYVGVDHYKSGRAAGFFMAKMTTENRFLAVCSDTTFRGEAARIAGFRDALVEQRGTRPTLDILEGEDWPNKGADPSITGLYFAGWKGSLSENLSRWSSNAPTVIAHDLGATEKALLQKGQITLAIDQNPEEQVARSVALILERLGFEAPTPTAPSVPFSILTAFNV